MMARMGRLSHLSAAARCGVLLACSIVLSIATARAQSSQQSSTVPQTQQSSSGAAPAQPTPPPDKPEAGRPEMDTRDSTIPLESRVNLVPIRVVVRDPKGHVVTDLRKEDFQVFEDGKLQDISHFSVE